MISPSDFSSLFDLYYPRLYAYVRSRVADQETAEDITAMAFERTLRHTYDPAKATFATWLFRIARNLVINHYLSLKRRPVYQELEEVAESWPAEVSLEQQLLHQEQGQVLTEALSGLSERDREIIQLKFFGRLTNRKIAEILELNEKSVSVIVLRALQKLKVRLEAQETS